MTPLKSTENEPEIHAKFVRAFTSDAFKLEIDPFNAEDLKQIKSVCEDWGKHWTLDFPHKSITSKGHILTFVLPRIAKKIFICSIKLSKKVNQFMQT